MASVFIAVVLAALSAQQAYSLVVVKPQIVPPVIKHAVAAFGPQHIGDPEKCKKNKDDCFPATKGELVGIKNMGSGSPSIIYSCDPSELPTNLPKDDFFILAMRDECEFSTKALVAQNAGAKGIIVYNSMFGEQLEIMRQVDGPDILIPSIFITRESGDELLELISSEPKVVAVINATGSWSWDGDNWQLTVLWFLFVAFIAMWVIVLACFSGAICRRWCHKTERQRAVGSLKRRKYKKVVMRSESAGDSKQEESDSVDEAASPCACDPESQFDQDSCVICLSEFENGENVTTLPCGHDYHTECIKPWLLKRSSKCPICKASFVTKKKKARTGAPSATLDANTSTPLLNSENRGDAEQIDEETEVVESGSDGEDFEEIDEDDDHPSFWPSSVLGLSPGGLVLTAACTTGIGIAVAIVIFLLKSSEP